MMDALLRARLRCPPAAVRGAAKGGYAHHFIFSGLMSSAFKSLGAVPSVCFMLQSHRPAHGGRGGS
jgi:hypothetical protein